MPPVWACAAAWQPLAAASLPPGRSTRVSPWSRSATIQGYPCCATTGRLQLPAATVAHLSRDCARSRTTGSPSIPLICPLMQNCPPPSRSWYPPGAAASAWPFRLAAPAAGIVTLVRPDGMPVPAGARVTLKARDESYPVGRNGRTYIPELPGPCPRRCPLGSGDLPV